MNIQKIINNAASSNFVKTTAKYANTASEKLGSVVSSALEKSPNKDIFSKIANTLEPTGANNAFIPMALLMVGTVIVPRVLTAAKRNPDDKEATKDEIAEILFRDVQTVVIILFAIFIWRGVLIAMKSPDMFGSLIAIGITAQIAIQVIINIAVVTSSMPATGMSLPFFSYGGTSLFILLCEMGILLNISKAGAKKE